MQKSDKCMTFALFSLAVAFLIAIPIAPVVSADNQSDDGSESTILPSTLPGNYYAEGTIVFKVDESGNLTWYKDFSRFNLFFNCNQVLVVSDGFILIGDGIMMLDPDCNIIWQRDLYIGGWPPPEYTSAVIVSDGIVAVGTTPGPMYKSGNVSVSTSIGLMTKYDFSGNIMWEKKSIWGGDDERFDSLVAMPDGFITVGTSYAIGSLTENNFKNSTSTKYITMYDNDGNIAWEKDYPKIDKYNITEAFISDGIIFSGTPIFITVGYKTDSFIEKQSFDGTVKWRLNIDLDEIDSVTEVPDGFIVLGVKNENGTLKEGDTVYQTTSDKAVIVKINNIGDLVWQKKFGGNGGRNSFNGVAAISDGYVVVGSSFMWSFLSGDWIGVEGKGSFDAIIVKYSKTGNLMWNKSFGGAESDYFKSITAIPNGFIVTGNSDDGSFGNGDWIGVESEGFYNSILIKYDNTGTVEEAYNIEPSRSEIDKYFDDLINQLQTVIDILMWSVIAGILAVVIVLLILFYSSKRPRTPDTKNR